MKKVFVIVLMLAYGLSSSGMTLNLHYCCGKLDDISIGVKKEKSCPMGISLKKTGCCSDKQISATSLADQQVQIKWLQINKEASFVPVSPVIDSHCLTAVVTDNRLARGAPILKKNLPLFLQYCSFRI